MELASWEGDSEAHQPLPSAISPGPWSSTPNPGCTTQAAACPRSGGPRASSAPRLPRLGPPSYSSVQTPRLRTSPAHQPLDPPRRQTSIGGPNHFPPSLPKARGHGPTSRTRAPLLKPSPARTAAARGPHQPLQLQRGPDLGATLQPKHHGGGSAVECRSRTSTPSPPAWHPSHRARGHPGGCGLTSPLWDTTRTRDHHPSADATGAHPGRTLGTSSSSHRTTCRTCSSLEQTDGPGQS